MGSINGKTRFQFSCVNVSGGNECQAVVPACFVLERSGGIQVARGSRAERAKVTCRDMYS